MQLDPDVVLQRMEEKAAESKREQFKNRDEPTGKLCLCGEEIIRQIRFDSAPRNARDIVGPGGIKPLTETHTLVCSGCGSVYKHLGRKLRNRE